MEAFEPIGGVEDALLQAIEAAHHNAGLGTRIVDIMLAPLCHSERYERDGHGAQARELILKLVEDLRRIPAMLESVRSYFTAAAGRDTYSFPTFGVQGANAHALAFRVIEAAIEAGAGFAGKSPLFDVCEDCEFLRVALEKEIDVVRDNLNYMPCDFAPAEHFAPAVDKTEWSKPMSKKNAAKLLGCPAAKKAEWINNCVKDGTLRLRPCNRQTVCFDMATIPANLHDKFRANSPEVVPLRQ